MLNYKQIWHGIKPIRWLNKFNLTITKTTFTTKCGIYCYMVMPFGLKNAGVTYQRMATTLLHDMMHNELEVYIDDMIVKSKDRENHTMNLRKFFERIKEYRLRLNPQK